MGTKNRDVLPKETDKLNKKVDKAKVARDPNREKFLKKMDRLHKEVDKAREAQDRARTELSRVRELQEIRLFEYESLDPVRAKGLRAEVLQDLMAARKLVKERADTYMDTTLEFMNKEKEFFKFCEKEIKKLVENKVSAKETSWLASFKGKVTGSKTQAVASNAPITKPIQLHPKNKDRKTTLG